MIEGFLDQTESKGYLAGFEYYEQLTKLEKDNIALLEQEYASLRNSLQESIDKGTVEIYSESWYEMTGQIFEVQEAIQEANSALIEYNNNMRELDWEIFDKTQDYISKIQEESEFIIGLMEDETLFDEDTGKYLCVIDLDTIMPGLICFDFGDAVRFAGNTCAEDETHLNMVKLDFDKFEALTKGAIATTPLNLG